MIDLPKMTHATLPDGLGEAEHSIGAMDVGDSGWTVPWAMYADEHRRLWLNGKYTLHAEPGGTVTMRVRRDEAGWHVDATGCRKGEQWGRGGFADGAQPIAVATFSR